MNFSIHLFGINNGRFIQHPSDGNAELLRQCAEATEKGATLTIRRSGTLVHYIYVRDISSSDSQQCVMGICIIFNGVYVNDLQTLSKTFESILSQIVMTGKLLKVNKDGSIAYNVLNFSDKRQDVEQIESYIKATAEESLCRYSVQFRQNFSGQIGTKTLPLKTDSREIIATTERFNIVRLYTDDDQEIGYISKMMSQLNDENETLRKELKELSKQKKQFKNVVILLLLVIGCGVGIYMLYNNLNATQSDLSATREHLDNANNEIAQKQDSLKTMSETIRTLQNSLSQEKSRCEEIEKTLSTKEAVLSKVESYMPIIITDVEIANVYNNGSYETGYGGSIYSSNTMYVKPRITYEGIKTGENINLRIKLYTPTGLSRGSSSPSDCSWAESMDVDEGNNTHSFQGWGGASKGHWSSGTYRYEFWYGNVCLKAKTFTIY